MNAHTLDLLTVSAKGMRLWNGQQQGGDVTSYPQRGFSKWTSSLRIQLKALSNVDE